MRKVLIILCILLAIVGCRPRGVLSNREMRNVLYDLHRVDGAIQVAGYNYAHDQEVAGYYKVDVIEFVDLAHSPKNLMIRARKMREIKRVNTPEIERLQTLYGFKQTLYELTKE